MTFQKQNATAQLDVRPDVSNQCPFLQDNFERQSEVKRECVSKEKVVTS